MLDPDNHIGADGHPSAGAGTKLTVRLERAIRALRDTAAARSVEVETPTTRRNP